MDILLGTKKTQFNGLCPVNNDFRQLSSPPISETNQPTNQPTNKQTNKKK